MAMDETLTRDQLRSRRARAVRAKTVSMKRFTQRDLAIDAALYPEDTRELRPRTRGECEDFNRPCVFVSCRFNLYLDVSPGSSAIKHNFPDIDPDELAHTCALDVADEGGRTLEDVGAIMNLTRERVRQLEVRALAKFALRAAKLREHVNEGPVGKRRLPVVAP